MHNVCQTAQPQEIFLKIFSFLDVEALVNCCKVSKIWRQLSMDNTCWEKVNYPPRLQFLHQIIEEVPKDANIKEYLDHHLIDSVEKLVQVFEAFLAKIRSDTKSKFTCFFPHQFLTNEKNEADLSKCQQLIINIYPPGLKIFEDFKESYIFTNTLKEDPLSSINPYKLKSYFIRQKQFISHFKKTSYSLTNIIAEIWFPSCRSDRYSSIHLDLEQKIKTVLKNKLDKSNGEPATTNWKRISSLLFTSVSSSFITYYFLTHSKSK
jgi:hypothetical protein